MLSLKIVVPFDSAPYIPATVGKQEARFKLCSDFGYTVEEDRLRPWGGERYPPHLAGKGTSSWNFRILDRKFGWHLTPEETRRAKLLINALRALGAVPDFVQTNVHEVHFSIFFDVSSKIAPAYYKLDTMMCWDSPDPFPRRQVMRVTVFCRRSPDPEIMNNIARLDWTLQMIFQICGISVVQ